MMTLKRLLNNFNFITCVVVGAPVVVDVLIVVDSVVVVTTTSVCIVGTSEFAIIDKSSSRVTTTVTSGGGTTAVVSRGDGGRVLALLRAIVGRWVAALVALTAKRLDTAVQRCPPQHRIIQLRTPAQQLFIYC
jgi:uncharacterized protein GlcG (DUF336 family)